MHLGDNTEKDKNSPEVKTRFQVNQMSQNLEI